MTRRIAHRSGFTLIEVILVLLVLGVLAAVVIPRVGNLGDDVRAEAERLRANLRYAQSLAMTGNTADWSVLISPQSYQLQRNGQPAPVNWPGGNAPLRVLAGGVTITGGAGVLAFDHLGAPPATVSIVLSDGARTATVTVLGFTGLVP